jgi:hypothetical protein
MTAVPLLLAEGPSIDGGVVALILAILLAIAIFTGVVTVGGAIWAYRAGRGARVSTVAWAVCAVIEAGAVIATTVAAGPNGIIPLLPLAVQYGCFRWGRARGPRPSMPSDPR